MGRMQKRSLLCRLLQVDRRNKRRKGFGNLPLAKPLIWPESPRVWEIAFLYQREHHGKTLPTLSVPWVGNCFSCPGPEIMQSSKALSDY